MRDQEWLNAALTALDLVYFDGALSEDDVKVKWWPFKVSRGIVIYGDYCQKQIRINRVLADPTVPTFVTIGTLFHETLHHVIGLEHDLTFSFAEAQYVHCTRAALWEREHFNRIVYMHQQGKK